MFSEIKLLFLKALRLTHEGNSFDGPAYWDRRAKKYGSARC
jgi:hypothetical protein